MAVPIVSLSSFLVGLTLAYTGAIILRQFGGDIWVADIVGLSTFREMGAVMTGVVIAGRTGAAFAAQIGNMKTGEEIDALETLGIPPVDFLVMPRLLALTLMTPLLTMYANCLGILGGMIVSASVLEIPPSAYWIETQTHHRPVGHQRQPYQKRGLRHAGRGGWLSARTAGRTQRGGRGPRGDVGRGHEHPVDDRG